MTFNDFCYNQLDGLYNPRFNYEDQCSGYKMLSQMLLDDITPATIDEMEDFENITTIGMEYHKQYVKCLRFLHPTRLEIFFLLRRVEHERGFASTGGFSHRVVEFQPTVHKAVTPVDLGFLDVKVAFFIYEDP